VSINRNGRAERGLAPHAKVLAEAACSLEA